VVAVAANQVPTYDRMSAGGYILPAGREPVRDACALAERLGDLVSGPGVLAAVARQAARLTDGQGCARVAEALAEAARDAGTPGAARPHGTAG
jgi:hypothetical protein